MTIEECVMKILKVSLLSLGLMASVDAFALSQGSLVTGDTSLGPITSSGSFDINVTKEDAVQISNLNDISIAKPSSGGAAVTGTDNVCYYATTNNYNITVSSTNNQSLKDASGNLMAYSLKWTDNTNSATATWSAAGLASGASMATAVASGNKTSSSCASSTNATLDVSIAAAAFDAAVTGKYSDTVSITIAGQ